MIPSQAKDYKSVTAEELVSELGGEWNGSNTKVCCPAHHDVNPSLSIGEDATGRVLWHCFAGCSQDDVLDAIRAKGLEPTRNSHPRLESANDDNDKLRRAVAIYKQCDSGANSVVETYLRARGITLPVPRQARLAPGHTLPPDWTSWWPHLPSMLLPVIASDGTGLLGLHITPLTHDGGQRVDRRLCGAAKGGVIAFGEITDGRLCIAEGVETALSVRQLTGIATWAGLNCGNLSAITLPSECREVIICADNDKPGLDAAYALARRAAKEGKIARVAVPEAEGTDWNDVLLASNEADDPDDFRGGATEAILEAETVEAPKARTLRAADLVNLELPPKKMLLSPWLPEQGITMLHAQAGVGKTWLALGVSFAVATGSRFLNWQAPAASEVLYLDGEMPLVDLQSRMRLFWSYFAAEDSCNLTILANETLSREDIMPDLSTPEGQKMIEEEVRDARLIVVDNIASLCRTGVENEAESWQIVQDWAVRQRARGRSILFVHHSGKQGSQRGTSKREGIMDTIIRLKRDSDYSPEEGAKFEIVYEKARGVSGKDVSPFSVKLDTDNGKMRWHILNDDKLEYIITAVLNGDSKAQIAKDLGVSRKTVHKHINRAKEDGLLKDGEV